MKQQTSIFLKLQLGYAPPTLDKIGQPWDKNGASDTLKSPFGCQAIERKMK